MSKRNDTPDQRATKKNEAPITLLQQTRVEARERGEKPRCGSPRIGSRDPEHANFGLTCKRLAGEGTQHLGTGLCSMHAGMMPSQQKAAAREEVAFQVRQYRKFYGDRVDVSFEDALMEELQRSVGVVRWLEDKISAWGQDFGDQEWKPGETGLPPMSQEHIGYKTMAISETEYAAWLRHYLLERKHLASVATAGINSGLAKEMVTIYQRQADFMNRIILLTLREFGIPDDDGRLHVILPRIIREVTGKV